MILNRDEIEVDENLEEFRNLSTEESSRITKEVLD